jgi:thiol-disulfide isomerase/thioredoxin
VKDVLETLRRGASLVAGVTAQATALSLVAACGQLDVAKDASPAKVEAPSVDRLPRDQWLTVDSVLPLSADGKEVRDEMRRPYSYSLLGQRLPDFSARLVGGGEATQELFRGKWTIVAVWGIWCDDSLRDASFVQRLSDLAEADPDIEFISIHTPRNRARAAEAYDQFSSVEAYFESTGEGYPTIIDADASLREAFELIWTPTYLLIGPDLGIHAFRTDLSVGDSESPARVLEGAKVFVSRSRSKG